jgi:hypothetical protein
MAMDEEEAKGSPDGGSEDGALQDHIAHWVEVLDAWVRRVDLGMGRRVGAARVGDRDGARRVDGDGLDESLLRTDDGAGSAKGIEG